MEDEGMGREGGSRVCDTGREAEREEVGMEGEMRGCIIF